MSAHVNERETRELHAVLQIPHCPLEADKGVAPDSTIFLAHSKPVMLKQVMELGTGWHSKLSPPCYIVQRPNTSKCTNIFPFHFCPLSPYMVHTAEPAPPPWGGGGDNALEVGASSA